MIGCVLHSRSIDPQLLGPRPQSKFLFRKRTKRTPARPEKLVVKFVWGAWPPMQPLRVRCSVVFVGARKRVPNTVTLFDLKVGVLVLKKLWAAAVFALCVIFVTDVQAGPTWIMDGKCKAVSRSKLGKMSDDLRSMPGEPIACDVAIVSRLKNGNWFFQFTEKQGNANNPIGFVLSGDGSTNPNGSFKIPLVRIYPPQPAKAIGEDRVVLSAKGACFANTRELGNAKELMCGSETEEDGYRLVMLVSFDVTKISYQELPD
jgi:hypothetical protein